MTSNLASGSQPRRKTIVSTFKEMVRQACSSHKTVMYERHMSMGPEVKEINWKHARGAFYRWAQVMRKSLSRAILDIFLADTNHSRAHQHVSADYRRCPKCLSSYSSSGERIQRCHGTDCHTGTIWISCRVHDHSSKGFRQIRQSWLAHSIWLAALDCWLCNFPRCSRKQQTCSLCGPDPCRNWSLQ